jgi:hypothetical protein
MLTHEMLKAYDITNCIFLKRGFQKISHLQFKLCILQYFLCLLLALNGSNVLYMRFFATFHNGWNILILPDSFFLCGGKISM